MCRHAHSLLHQITEQNAPTTTKQVLHKINVLHTNVFNVSAVLSHYAVQTTTPFADALVDGALLAA